MIKLIEVTINKYKSFQSYQTIKIEDDITVLVGMNEAGKTVLLEAMAKLQYFNPKDIKFKFELTQDYPRKELIQFQKSKDDADIIRAKYSIGQEHIDNINQELGVNCFTQNTFEIYRRWKNKQPYVNAFTHNFKPFLDHLVEKYKHEIGEDALQSIQSTKNFVELTAVQLPEGEGPELTKFLTAIKNASKWTDQLSGYIYNTYIEPQVPKFWYFDDYYQLDGRINFNDYKAGKYGPERAKMVEALLDIAGINIDDLLGANDFENFTAQLEAASNEISEQMFKYWKGNENLEIELKIDKIIIETKKENKVYHPNYPGQENHAHKETYIETKSEIILDIRIKNTTHKITLPLERRSKGFNWFFSFVVWFNKVKNDPDNNYILLFDEPGLNLHALAQNNLLVFLDDLSQEYQVIYSTHSPFMIDSGHLNRVRTVLETSGGSVASETIQEKDPNTLFPLQAALGYDIAQNLFISKNNLLVEGPADLLYLTYFSTLLQSMGRTGLKEGITIVPVGGLDKVASFISLMRGNKLHLVCLLDTFTDSKGKSRLDDLIKSKIIKSQHILFFHEFVSGSTQSDIEDLFEKEDYLKIFNEALNGKFKKLNMLDLNPSIGPIVIQINQALSIDRYNHYSPAIKLTQMGVTDSYFNSQTLANFQNLFEEINNLF
ncbi:hypothetical protein A3860_25995 [Niastella vici]|uniref:Uncharacterized protein n=1 Tax=Niastella vici TaxID=1703345 RepID=A0A1V9FWS7_9BACT|nr:AAA family ATPase [Niastella vici]OQP62770.1 hypothetical protein A3860_25995 [Niastella vici]